LLSSMTFWVSIDILFSLGCVVRRNVPLTYRVTRRERKDDPAERGKPEKAAKL